jgi:hypothetical protein
VPTDRVEDAPSRAHQGNRDMQVAPKRRCSPIGLSAVGHDRERKNLGTSSVQMAGESRSGPDTTGRPHAWFSVGSGARPQVKMHHDQAKCEA